MARYLARAFVPEQGEHLAEELEVAAVVRRETDGLHVLLDGRADNVAHGAMVTEVNDLDTVPDQFEVDGNDGAVVAVTNRNGSKDAGEIRFGAHRDL